MRIIALLLSLFVFRSVAFAQDISYNIPEGYENKISKDKPVDFVKFIQRTKPFIEKSYKEHPQPVSDQYFWLYKGRFTKINVLTGADGHINVISPFGLTALMTHQQ